MNVPGQIEGQGGTEGSCAEHPSQAIYDQLEVIDVTCGDGNWQ